MIRSAALVLAVLLPLPGLAADAAAEQKLFRDIYQELIEINTSHSAGDNTRAANAMAGRLRAAGFAAGEIHIFEPFPRKGNLVMRYKGSGEKKPMLLIAHLDVVEAKREDWDTDPFKLQESGGYFTARGSIDDKAMASIFVSVLGQLKREGWAPKRDVILALTSDEERGDVPSNGAAWLVNNQRALIEADFGINEGGGGELRNGKAHLHRIQVAEKVFVTYELEVTNPGGHSSVPKPDNAINQLVEALARIAQYQFPAKMSEVTRTYFERSAAFASGQQAEDMRAVARENPDPAAMARLSANPFYNAQLRTTCIATMLEAGHAENALPQRAKATVNCRILPNDDAAEVERRMKTLAGDKVAVRHLYPPTLSPPSPLRPDVLGAVEKITAQMWPGVPVVPAMSTGATDSRFLRNIGMPMYGVSGLFAEPADLRTHGLNERILVKQLYEGREFLYRLVKELGG
ncbi:MAG TPA: M20/M25/M40 family metallo-hydrolase [Burkholderiales bacterium]|nr:M20/M25/M40 family metallo-hydrolase [Burkholderiales bacterium]